MKEVKKGIIQYLSMSVYTPLVLHVPVVTRMLWEGGKGGGEREREREGEVRVEEKVRVRERERER